MLILELFGVGGTVAHKILSHNFQTNIGKTTRI